MRNSAWSWHTLHASSRLRQGNERTCFLVKEANPFSHILQPCIQSVPAPEAEKKRVRREGGWGRGTGTGRAEASGSGDRARFSMTCHRARQHQHANCELATRSARTPKVDRYQTDTDIGLGCEFGPDSALTLACTRALRVDLLRLPVAVDMVCSVLNRYGACEYGISLDAVSTWHCSQVDRSQLLACLPSRARTHICCSLHLCSSQHERAQHVPDTGKN